jgi:hypothetical protein
LQSVGNADGTSLGISIVGSALGIIKGTVDDGTSLGILLVGVAVGIELGTALSDCEGCPISTELGIAVRIYVGWILKEIVWILLSE